MAVRVRITDGGKSVVVKVLVNGGPFGGGYPRWKVPFYKTFAREGREGLLA